MLVVCNWSRWEHLPHRNWQVLQISATEIGKCYKSELLREREGKLREGTPEAFRLMLAEEG